MGILKNDDVTKRLFNVLNFLFLLFFHFKTPVTFKILHKGY